VVVGAISLAAGLAVAPSTAAGESTTAVLTSPLSGTSATFTWTYQFNANGGHALSNIAIRFCSTDFLAHVVSATPSGEAFIASGVPGGHAGFGPGIKFSTEAASGTLTVVFDQTYPATGTMEVQSHSGDGNAGDLVTQARGPGDCGAIPSTTPGSTTTTVGPTTTTVSPTTTSVPATTTTVLVTTTSTATPNTTPGSTTIATPTTTTTVPATTTSIPTSVLGNRFVNDDPAADLAGTGFRGGPVVAFGALCLALGAVLVVGARLERSRN
jgi:hypothetical protein